LNIQNKNRNRDGQKNQQKTFFNLKKGRCEHARQKGSRQNKKYF